MSKALTTPMREMVKSEGESEREGRGEMPMRERDNKLEKKEEKRKGIYLDKYIERFYNI